MKGTGATAARLAHPGAARPAAGAPGPLAKFRGFLLHQGTRARRGPGERRCRPWHRASAPV